jgi:hypothetical protein
VTSIDIAPPAVPMPGSQGTAIEQSRAVAQVQAAVVIARNFPRDEQRAIRLMQEACARPSLANKAFYEYRRGNERVTGSTIKLAQELARIWGNIDFGMTELSVDPVNARSEMLAYAWDLEANTRFGQIVIVHHLRDKRVNGEKVAERVQDQRDVYEMNISNSARRLREAIRRVVPDWFFDEAETICRRTLENPGDGLTLAQRISRVAAAFEGKGIDAARLEARVGKPAREWTAFDVAQLKITWESLGRGETTPEEAFPLRATMAEVSGPTTPRPPAAAPPDEPADQPASAEAKASRAQLTKLHTLLTTFGVENRDERLETVNTLAGSALTTTSDLTKDQATTLIDKLEDLQRQDNPAAALDLVLAELANADAQEQR